MSKVQTLRAFVKQRLTAAAEEIFEQFERTIAEYEEEVCRQQKLLDAVFKPEVRLHRADVQQLLVSQDEDPSEQQEDPPELPHIKEEQEEPRTSQEGEQLGGLEEFTFSPVPVKSEEDDEEKPQSSQLHQSQTEEDRDEGHLETGADGEDCGGSESDRKFDPDHLQPAPHDKTSDSSEPETDDSCDWEESREPQSGLKPLKNSEIPGSDLEGNSGKTSTQHLQKHDRIQTAAKPLSCSVCGKGYHRKKSFRKHVRLHLDGKSLHCPVCQKAFEWRSDIVRHMRIHTGEKPFSCSVCGVRFVQSSSLTAHFRVHTGEKPFSCSICEERFSLRNNLYEHVRMHNGERPFHCSVCGKRFGTRRNLRRHLAVHSGEKPFSCSVCGKRFALNDILRQHLAVHTGEKPFSCTVCGKKFTRLHTLKKHKCAGESSK
ncbi:zinc finger protein 135-like [Chelmon rostratus]|uniref:zinc finger protein 135-like n=1 Tax=Chelmon rostratus TaxID=109905 RepID=UPI001BE5AA57|nr:zinc finger protein 135-like [Chelmon rostratus]